MTTIVKKGDRMFMLGLYGPKPDDLRKTDMGQVTMSVTPGSTNCEYFTTRSRLHAKHTYGMGWDEHEIPQQSVAFDRRMFLFCVEADLEQAAQALKRNYQRALQCDEKTARELAHQKSQTLKTWLNTNPNLKVLA